MPDMKEMIIEAVIILGNIAVMFVILRMLVYKPLRGYLTKRTDKINGQLAQAEKMMSEARAMREDVDREILENTDNAERMMQESETRARQRGEEIINEAKRAAAELLDEARARADEERRAAIERMRGDIADMAVQISSRMLQREVSAADNRHIIEDYFKKCVPNGTTNE